MAVRRRTKVIIAIASVVAFMGAILAVGGFLWLSKSVKVFYTPSDAMAPTLRINDRMLAETVRSDSAISRGAIVVFRPPPNQPDPEIKHLIKRVVGLPGERIESVNGLVHINGVPLNEPYLAIGEQTAALPSQVVPDNTYYVLGDNRSDSTDSRVFGPVSRDLIEWRATRIIDPVERRKDL